MVQASQQRPPSPAIVFETLQGYHRTAALRGAIHLDLFTAIGEGNTTVKPLAARIRASEKGTRILCDFLTVIGLLTKNQDAYSLTPDSAMFLDRKSPAYMGSATNFLCLPELTGAFDDVAAVVRKGGTVISEQGSMEPENPIWVEFARSMAGMMATPGEFMARMLDAGAGQKWKVLDIAAGHGLFGIAIARHNPNASVVALDWTSVLAVAQENARAAGLADRYSIIPGSAFDVDFGSGYDIVLLTNFLHHFDPATNEALLRKVHAALKPGGRAVTLEFIPNEDRISPPMDATFALTMLGGTAGGDAYTFSEYDRMFHNAGFARNEMRELTPLPNRVIVSYK